MAPRPSTEELLRKLDEQQKAYINTFQLIHEALSHNLSASTAPASPVAPSKRRRRSTLDIDAETPARKVAVAATFPSSVVTGESDSSDEDDELYVQTPLPAYKFDHEHLRHHLKTHRFHESGKTILETVVDNGSLVNPALFPQYQPSDRSHNSHYSVFDVGLDGAPLSRHEVVQPGTTSIDSAIWQAIQDLNSNPAGQRPAVGRISIIREPSPIIFGALHLTMNEYFDMDEIFAHLVSSDTSAAHIASRAFSIDHRQQRSFVFNFDYYTVIGDDCAPMPWQLTDIIPKKTSEHIPISRCSSVVALSLSGGYIRKLRNAARRARTQDGYVYDPWAPWHVLNIQCYPDHKHSMDSHDSTKHYVNGPEAFLTTLLAEFKDAQKRFEELYNKISKLVTPPADFMFNRKLRDKLLFEDAEFTYSRRYFWAYQTLGMLKNGIKAIIDAYQDTFTDEVWEGKDKCLWPMIEEDSARNVYWRKRMHSLKKDFEKEIRGLEKLYEENDDLRKDIRTLRDQLFSGTSVLESRKSVELSEVTILQGHNIKLLTLVSIFFLPLTFVTSVFGMTNMPTERQFTNFGIVMATVCIPFFLLIGFLNTTAGMEFWRHKWHRIQALVSAKDRNTPPTAAKLFKAASNSSPLEIARKKRRSPSASEAMAIRMALVKPIKRSPTSTLNDGPGNAASTSSSKPTMPAVTTNDVAVTDGDSVRGKETTHTMKAVGSTERAGTPRSETDASLSLWLGKLMRRERQGFGREHVV